MSLSKSYANGRRDHQAGLSANPWRHARSGADFSRERLDAIADYDRGYAQSAAEWAPAYSKGWPADIGL